MLLGMFIVTYVGSLRGVIVETNDITPLNHRLTRICWRDGVRYKTRTLLVPDGAEGDTSEKRIMRSAYKKAQMNYWYYLEIGLLDKAVHNRERAERMSKYVKSPDPE